MSSVEKDISQWVKGQIGNTRGLYKFKNISVYELL